MPLLFADRIVNVMVTGTLIRLELGAFGPPAAEGEQPKLQATQTLVMPLDGFLASFGMLDAMAKKMVADGMLKPRPPTDPAPTAEANNPAALIEFTRCPA